jgi:hypothetical protein
MTEPADPKLPELGDALPPTTRFCPLPEDGPAVRDDSRLVAFIPGNQFVGNGRYLLSAAGTLEVRSCRGLPGGDRIEITSSDGRQVVSFGQFAAAAMGRVVGILKLDVPSASLDPHVAVQIVKRRADGRHLPAATAPTWKT